jgi:hypothetical protein
MNAGTKPSSQGRRGEAQHAQQRRRRQGDRGRLRLEPEPRRQGADPDLADDQAEGAGHDAEQGAAAAREQADANQRDRPPGPHREQAEEREPPRGVEVLVRLERAQQRLHVGGRQAPP